MKMTARGAIICFIGAAFAAIGAGGEIPVITGIGVFLLVTGFAMAVIGRLMNE